MVLKNLLKKIGIDTEKEHTCIRCSKPLDPRQKRCPHCRAWNDCCSIDPELLKQPKKEKQENRR